MSDVAVRPLADTEYRAAHELFVRSLQAPQPMPAERWERSSARYEAGRAFGAFLGEELSGTAMSLTSSLVVPGGAVLPAAAVTGVGVRADRTRRGLLRELMRAQLADVRARGEPVAVLHASETPIYPRFGYGLATRTQRLALRTSRADLRPEAPGGGQVRLVDGPAAEKLLPEVYRRLATRPGMIARPDGWWRTRLADHADHGGGGLVAVRSDADGIDDGFAIYRPDKADHVFGDGSCTVRVGDLQAAGAAAEADLWRFLLGLDLVTDVVAADRPVDEALPWWLRDWRACRVDRVDDDLWVRLVDVPRALAARGYGAAEPVVVRVSDPVLPENAGRYRISPEGAEPTGEPAQLAVDVADLGAVYLGDLPVSTLAEAGRVEVAEPAALPRADALFTAARPPWCGTPF